MKHNGLESGRLSSSGEALYELLDIARRKRSDDGVSVSAEELRKDYLLLLARKSVHKRFPKTCVSEL